MIRTCKVKLGRAPKQEAVLLEIIGLCQQLYNAALQQRIEAYRKQGVSLTLYDQQKELTLLRKEIVEYGNLPVVLTRLTSLKRLDKAFKAFYRRVKRGEKPGFPRYKSRDRFNTLCFDGETGWKIDGKKLIIKMGSEQIILRMQNKIYRKGEIKGLQLVKKVDRWWVHFQLDVGDTPQKKQPKNQVGIDVGLKEFATLSDGVVIENPRFVQKSQEKIKDAHQVLSRKQKGSNNRKKSKLQLERIYNKVSNRRENFIFQTVAQLVKDYDGFAVEKLNINSMLKSKPGGMGKKQAKGLHRNIMDASWGMFLKQLENKAEEAGFPVVKVDPKNTTQACSGCGFIVKKTLKDRIHSCPECGLVLDRDLNAARNILQLSDLGCRSVCKSTEAFY